MQNSNQTFSAMNDGARIVQLNLNFGRKTTSQLFTKRQFPKSSKSENPVCWKPNMQLELLQSTTYSAHKNSIFKSAKSQIKASLRVVVKLLRCDF